MLTRKASSSGLTSTPTRRADKATTYTKSDVDNILTGKPSSSDLTSALARKADKSTTYTENDVNNVLQQNKDGSFRFYDYTDPGNVYSGGVCSHPTKLICRKSNTTSPADDNILMRLDDTYAYFAKKRTYTHLTMYNVEEFFRPTGQTKHDYLKLLNMY